MHEYKTARTIFSFCEFVAWCAFAIGIIVFLAGLGLGGSAGSGLFRGSSGLAAYVGALPGFSIMFLSILMVMFIQVGRAAVDTSERTGQLIRLNEEHLKIVKAQQRQMQQTLATGAVSQEAAKKPATPVKADAPSAAQPAPAFVAPTVAPAPPKPKPIEHLGRMIEVIEDGYRIDGNTFKHLDQAKGFIDSTTLVARR